MSLLFIVMLIASLLFLYLIIRHINQNKLLFAQAFSWLFVAILLIFMAVFNAIPVWFAQHLGFELTSNFILALAIFFLLIISFFSSLHFSKQDNQIKELTQALSLTNKRVSELEKRYDQ